VTARAACHCGAVRFELEAPPTWVLDCTCTLCRRYAALWAYTERDGHVTVTSPPTAGETEVYLWNGRGLGFHRCRTCGCVTHMEAQEDPPRIYGLNMRLLSGGLDAKSVVVRQIDNGHTGSFFTVSDQPELVSRHPVEPPHAWR
jgi:hypothetical protein